MNFREPGQASEPHVVAQAKPAAWRFPARGTALRLFITCWLVYVLHFATNTVREIYPALSLGDHLSFDVSEYVGFHDDIFEIPGRGAFINNNPGASILGAIPYALARPVLDGIVDRVQQARAAAPEAAPRKYNARDPKDRLFYKKVRDRGLDVKFGLAQGVMQAFCMAPLSALSALVMFYVLLSLTRSGRASLFLALLYAFATPVFYRTAQLNHNLLVSHCGFFSFALLWRPWDDPGRLQRPSYLLAGLICGWAVVCDYSAVVVVVVLGAYAVARRSSLPTQARSPWDLSYFALGVAIPVVVLMAYQYSCFGNPFLPAQFHMDPKEWTYYGHKGMGWPQVDLLWETAFGTRYGLFTSAPFLVLALLPSGWLSSRTRIVGSREMWCILSLSLMFFLFCSANQYGRMQFNTGVRHVVPVTPFLFLVAAGVLLQFPAKVAKLFAVLTIYWSWCLAMYRDVEWGLGVFESLYRVTFEGFRLPWLTTLERMGYVSGVSVIPLFLLAGTFLWIVWDTGSREAETHGAGR